MFHVIALTAAAAVQAQPAAGEPDQNIIVTGSRTPVAVEDAAVSATLFDASRIAALSLPLASDVLRLAPGVSVASAGPRGTQTQVRIRGAEASHTLLFVDGIRFNDPAAVNEARFELLTTDLLSRIEIVRGPQSALWGSEALGGVVALETADPSAVRGLAALAEYGSLDTARASAQASIPLGPIGLSGGGGWIRSDGIDSFGADGERDGFENRSANLKAVFAPLPALELGLAGHWIEGRSEYDGEDPVTFRRADTLHSTDNRIAAVRGWASLDRNGWTGMVDASYLDSVNRNRLAEEPLNRTFGERLALGAQLSREVGSHRLTAAIEHEEEEFSARDQSFGGFTNQDQARQLTAFVGEWKAEWSDRLTTDIALRHDDFSAFSDATTVRASALFRPARHWSIQAAYGEGIAQPTFYDLFGFFPGSFRGNPDLRPERSKGYEVGLRWGDARGSVGITGFRNRLRDEIVETFDFTTFLPGVANAGGESRRQGIELEGQYRLAAIGALSLSYTYLDAQEKKIASGAAIREVRRPRHSASAALTGESGPLNWGASLAYTGERADTDFDVFPSRRVILDDYLLASLKLGYRLTPALEAYGRVENAFDSDCQDAVGYHMAGRTVYAGLRLHLGR